MDTRMCRVITFNILLNPSTNQHVLLIIDPVHQKALENPLQKYFSHCLVNDIFHNSQLNKN